MTEKELEKYDLLVGFVNDIAEIVCDPEEYLDPNTKDSTAYSIGYCLNNKNEPILSDIECDESITAISEVLKELIRMVKDNSSSDYSKEWEKLR